MAKVSRSVLKKIVKECLVEILFEGLDDEDSVLGESRKTRFRPKVKKSDEEEFQEKVLKRKKMLRERTQIKADGKHLANQITNDPVMAEIFADTAQNTLPGMLAGDNKGRGSYVPADGAARLAQENDPEDHFEGAGNWAHLAFTPSTKPR